MSAKDSAPAKAEIPVRRRESVGVFFGRKASAVGGPGSIRVVRKNLGEIVLQASSDVEFDYVVNGVRKAYRDFQAIRENGSFVPDGPDDRRFALYAPEIQRRLVATGIYNADGTVNLETAKRLGWDRTWREKDAAQ